MDMIKMSMGLVIAEKGVDRRHLLYNRKGHKSIQIKQINKKKIKLDYEEMKLVDARLDRLYDRYDTLVSY